jgi:hypothetical protein
MSIKHVLKVSVGTFGQIFEDLEAMNPIMNAKRML